MVYYLYAKVLQSTGQITEAIKHLHKAIKLEPSNKEYQRVLHVMVRSKPKPQIRKSESLAPIGTHKIYATPDGLNDNLITKKQRSFTDENIKLTVIKDTPILKPPTVINDFSNVNAPGANDNDEYFKKAVQLYKNKQYDEAEIILKLVVSIKPNHEAAQRLYKYLSKKMYINNPTVERHRNNSVQSRPRSNTPSIKDMAESKQNESKMDENDKDPCQIEFIRFLDDSKKIMMYMEMMKGNEMKLYSYTKL